MRDEDGTLRFIVSEELRARFSFETKVLPLPDADDFRVSIGDQDRERIKRQIAESIQASLRVGTRELWQRLYKVVSHLSARMSEYNAAQDGSKPRLYDSMITNIVEIVDVLPKLNIAGDTELDRMASEIRRSLVVDPQELRKSETMRSDTAKAAVDIAQRMAAYMGVPVTAEVS
jgi:DNA-binding transcriptional regulator/RsmH inhibitor MraZ